MKSHKNQNWGSILRDVCCAIFDGKIFEILRYLNKILQNIRMGDFPRQVVNFLKNCNLPPAAISDLKVIIVNPNVKWNSNYFNVCLKQLEFSHYINCFLMYETFEIIIILRLHNSKFDVFDSSILNIGNENERFD